MTHSCTAVVPLFKNLNDEARAAIDALTHANDQVEKGTVLISPDTAAHLLVVAHGKLKTSSWPPMAKEHYFTGLMVLVIMKVKPAYSISLIRMSIPKP